MLGNATLFVCLLTITPIGSASAQSSDYIYWTEDTKVRRASLDGTGVQDLVTDVNIGVGIALDLTNNHIYWVERGSNKIRRANLDGSSPQDIITGLRSGRGRGIALDLTNNHIYWGVDGGEMATTVPIWTVVARNTF